MTQKQKAFFRMDLDLPCYYKVLTRDEAEQSKLPMTVNSDYMRKHFIDQLNLIDDEIVQYIDELSQKSTLMSNCIKALNRKLDFLIQTVDETQLANVLPIQQVNLSANGIAIEVKEPIDMSSKVDLIMRPLEHETPVAVRCDVVHITPKPETNSSWVAMSYQAISEDNRRKLIYFIQTKEIENAK